jgi:hypothetical protein
MTERDPSEMAVTGPVRPQDHEDNGRNPYGSRQDEYPYGDAGNLYEIPRVRPDDPPMRHWWMDDEPRQDGSGPQA